MIYSNDINNKVHCFIRRSRWVSLMLLASSWWVSIPSRLWMGWNAQNGYYWQHQAVSFILSSLSFNKVLSFNICCLFKVCKICPQSPVCKLFHRTQLEKMFVYYFFMELLELKSVILHSYFLRIPSNCASFGDSEIMGMKFLIFPLLFWNQPWKRNMYKVYTCFTPMAKFCLS